MYSIDRRPYGYALTFRGAIDGREMAQWLEQSKCELPTPRGEFCVFVDMRELEPLAEDAQVLMNRGQKLYKDRGMVRSVVILANPVTTIQFKRIAKETGIYRWERYIDASKGGDWEDLGMRWLRDGTDPDARQARSPDDALTDRRSLD